MARRSEHSLEEIKEMVKHTIILAFEEVTDITPDVRITFYNAGHIAEDCSFQCKLLGYSGIL